MIRIGLIASALLFTATAPVHAAVSRIGFTLRSDGAAPLQVQFERRGPGTSRNQWSQSFAPGELSGLDLGRLRFGRTPVAFSLVRPAGRLDCSGEGTGGRAAGQCRFTGNPQFAAALQQRGVGRPTDEEAYQLALGGVGLRLVDALARAGTKPDIKGLIACGIFKVTPELVDAYAALGYRGLTTGQLTEFQIFKVTPEIVRAYAALGYERLSPRDLVQFQIFKVTPDYIRSVNTASERMSPQRLVQRRILGPQLSR